MTRRPAAARGALVAAGVLALTAGAAAAATTVVVVEGIGGTDQYRREFADQVDAIAAAAQTLSPPPDVQVFRAGTTRDAILTFFESLSAELSGDDQLAVYLIGHGSYDDHEYKFNIAGPDLTDADILAAMQSVASSNQLLVNTSSASGAGRDMWQADDRVVITATRSGAERHATRFGIRFAAALSNEAADLDKNQIVTAQEAFEFAERGVRDFFEESGSLATEHAELSGERADRLSLARLSAARRPSGDAELTRLLAARDTINGAIGELRLRRDELPSQQYQDELFDVMLELAEVEEAIERREAELGGNE